MSFESSLPPKPRDDLDSRKYPRQVDMVSLRTIKTVHIQISQMPGQGKSSSRDSSRTPNGSLKKIIHSIN